MSSLLPSAHSLLLDRATAALVGALAEVGVETVLLKGPAVTARLYTDGGRRTYRDCDLLVAPGDRAVAGTTLTELGYAPLNDAEAAAPFADAHAQAWQRATDRVQVDLHWTLAETGASPREVWETVRARTRQLTVGGRELAVPGDETLALILMLHLIHHNGRGRVAEDAERALAELGEPVWRAAAELAERLGAATPFGAGVRLAGGRELAERLGLADDPVRRRLAAEPEGARAEVLERLARTRGTRAKLRVMRRLVVPRGGYLHTHPRGPESVGPRLLRVVRTAPGTVRAWRRARRSDDGR